MTIRIIIADDHSVVRQGLRMFLSLDPDLEVVGEAVNGAEAVERTAALLPDVVLMDLIMPVMSGLQATAEIRRRGLPTQVIVVTSVIEEAAVTAVLKTGAIGYLLKDTEADELRRAIKAAAAGHPQLSPTIAGRLLAETQSDGADTLTDRDTEVLRLAAQGLSDQEIALRLLVSEPVIQSQVAGIVAKLRQADEVARSIEQARLERLETRWQHMEHDLQQARRIQMSLLPGGYPRAEGWDFAATYESAREIGGDLYDFIEWPDDPARIGLLIADVSGKGTAAALFMAHSRAMIRGAAQSRPSPAATLAAANVQIAHDNHAMLFVSAFYAVLDTADGRLTFANAGHNLPLIRRAGGRVEEVLSRGMVLGIMDDMTYDEAETVLAAGDTLLLYTDGITEAMNADSEMFGKERLIQALALVPSPAGGELGRGSELPFTDPSHRAGEQNAAGVVAAVVAAVRAFVGDTPQADDLTIVAARRIWNSEPSDIPISIS